MDLHRKRSHVVALDDVGDVLLSRRVDTRPDALLRVFGELEPAPIEVAFEATFGWGWFADLLADAGIPAQMAHPLATKAISSARVKNDFVDATTLAHLLRTHLLPEAWIAPPEVREARRLARMRTSLVRIRSQLKCQVHAVLAEHGVLPGMSDAFGRTGRRFLQNLELPPISAHRIEANLRLVDAVSDEIAVAERELRTLFRGRRPDPAAHCHPRDRADHGPPPWSPRCGTFPGSPPRTDCAPGQASPRRSAPAPSTPVAATSPSRAHGGSGGCWWRRPPVPTSTPTSAGSPIGSLSAEGTKIARVALARRLLTLSFYALRDQGGCRAFPLVA